MDAFYRSLEFLLGLGNDPKDLDILQVSMRAVTIFLAALVMVRVADKRFLSRKTAFDVVLGLVLASMLARAINGSGPLFPTILGGFVLVGLHRTLAHLAVRSHRFGCLIKGYDDEVVRDGTVLSDKLKRHNFSERDLLEDLRLNAGIDSPDKVLSARIERNGDLSVVKKSTPDQAHPRN